MAGESRDGLAPLVWRRDALWGAALAAVTLLWFTAWPRDLNWYDEALYLYESKRMLAGDVLYRDLFEIVTPGAWYVMAAMFGVFGTSFATARAVMAVLHLCAVLCLFLTCRVRGVRRPLAAAAGLAYIALSYPGMPYASPHWFSTFFNAVLLLVFSIPAVTWSRRRLFVAGLVCGALVLVQQHRGTVMAVGAAALVLLDHGIEPRLGVARERLGNKLGLLFAGFATLAIPVLAVMFLTAGASALFDCLVRFPLSNYRHHHESVAWGGYAGGVDIIPWLVTWLPVTMAVPVVRLAVRGLRSSGAAEAKALLAQSVLGLAALLSIAYHPDVKHLAAIAPLYYVIVADTLEWCGRRVAAFGRPFVWASNAVIACVIGGLAAQLYLTQVRRHALYPFRQDTPFGVVEYTDTDEQILVDTLRTLLAEDGTTDIFCFPHCPGLYLTTGTHNPTRYQLLHPDYSGPDRVDDALQVLESQRVRYVVAEPLWLQWRSDPVVAYVRQHYDRVKLEHTAAPKYALFKRRQ